VTTLVLAAHGSADPRSAANAHAVARGVRLRRPGLDVRVGFCERSLPNLRDVLDGLAEEHRSDVTVVPLLLADAYHARVDIPSMIAKSVAQHHGLRVSQADVLGADGRLVAALRERVLTLEALPREEALGVLVVAVGSLRDSANARTAMVAPALAAGTRWVGAATAFATAPQPSLDDAVRRLRYLGATRLVIAPWFLAPGRLTDRVADYARSAQIAMAAPLGAHRLVVETVLDRFDQAVSRRSAA
jgi:sirohydrochlorin ferrochelatase